VSLRTTKEQAQAQAGAGLDRARQVAIQVRPVAKDAATEAAARLAPLAKNASAAATQAGAAATQAATKSVQDASEWARPRITQGVHDAREWAAPRIEQAGHVLSDTVAPKVTVAITDSVAPKVSEVMTATARRIEPASQAGKHRTWPRVIAGLALAAGLGSVIAIVLRRRSAQLTDDIMADDETVEPPAETEADGEEVIVEAEVGANGNGPTP
jgi:hypothetical protein